MTHPTIWFLRHGQTDWNAARRIQGQLESHLTDTGRWQAGEQARIIESVLKTGPDIVVSPLARAQETAAIALAGHSARADPRLMEIHAGDWQGRYYDEVVAEHPHLANKTALELFAEAPGGEGIIAFRARIAQVLADITSPTVIVAHGLWGQVARGLLCALSDADTRRLDNLQGVVYKLENRVETILRAPSQP